VRSLNAYVDFLIRELDTLLPRISFPVPGLGNFEKDRVISDG